MARFIKKRSEMPGLPPGTLVFTGTRKMAKAHIRVMDYDEKEIAEYEPATVEQAAHTAGKQGTVTWLNIDGVHDTELIQEVGRVFNLNLLLLEDIANTGQRPKMEDFTNGLLVALKMLRLDTDGQSVISEQFSMVIGEHFLITFQEQAGDVFEPVRERLRNGRKRIRSSGPDYLAYALLDTMVEQYLHIVEVMGEHIERNEERIMRRPNEDLLRDLNDLKQEMNYLRKVIRPAREMVIQLNKTESDLVRHTTFPFLRDTQDLITQASEVVDSYRDMLSDQLNIYHTLVSAKMNDVMKVLTIFAAIFIPLTFIAGIYGTNFDHLPELHYKYSYYIMLSAMALVVVGMLWYFKRKHWF